MIPAKPPVFGIPSANDVQFTQINFVDMPNAVQSELAVMNIIDLKMADEDYHAALITNYIFGGAFSSYINMNLREKMVTPMVLVRLLLKTNGHEVPSELPLKCVML